MSTRRRGQGGFTVIEFLVAVAILGILAAVVVFAVGNTKKHPVTPPTVVDTTPEPISGRAQCFAQGGDSYTQTGGCHWSNTSTPDDTTTTTVDPYGG